MNLASKALSILVVAAFVGLGAIGHDMSDPSDTSPSVTYQEAKAASSNISYCAPRSQFVRPDV